MGLRIELACHFFSNLKKPITSHDFRKSSEVKWVIDRESDVGLAKFKMADPIWSISRTVCSISNFANPTHGVLKYRG